MLIKSFQIALLQQGHLAEFDTTGILYIKLPNYTRKCNTVTTEKS